VVVELSIDLAVDGSCWRHPVRFVHVRGDVTPADLAGEMRVAEVTSRACPADHGTGSRSQILIEARSMVPRKM
jgi:hypothetical protein